ncbi:transposase, partial [Hydrogenophaga sp.]
MVVEPQSLQSLSAEELRELTTRLMTQLRHQSALLDKLTHENALLKRMKFTAQSERFGERFNPEQKSLLEDEIEADLAAVATEIDALQEAQTPAKLEEKRNPKRAPLPANLPRREIRHEPDSTTCACGC